MRAFNRTVRKEKKEREILHEIIFYLRKKNIFCFENTQSGFFDGKSMRTHSSPYVIKGVSDVIGIFNGRFMAIEVKKKSEYVWFENFLKANKSIDGKSIATQKKYFHFLSQKKFLDEVRKNGGIAFFAYSVECVERNLFSDQN